MRLFLKKVAIFFSLLWTGLVVRLKGDNLHQGDFIPRANKILSEPGYSALYQDGECSSLTNLYILYASQGRQHEFFSILKRVTNHSLRDVSREYGDKIKDFMHQLITIKNTDGIYLRNVTKITSRFWKNNDHVCIGQAL